MMVFNIILFNIIKKTKQITPLRLLCEAQTEDGGVKNKLEVQNDHKKLK